MMIDTPDRHAAFPHRAGQHAEPAQVGDIEHHDHVRAPQLFHRFGAAVHAGQRLKQEIVPGRGRSGIGDHDLNTARAQEVGESGLTPQPIAIGIDVGGQADPHPGLQSCGKPMCRREFRG